jgi:pimeloyl-ACP methyl ester carboxylesterase
MALIVLVALYLGVCVLVFCVQRKLVYFPPVRDAERVMQFAKQAKLERWKTFGGDNVGMKRFAAKQPAEASVLICYGNGSSATGCAHYADALQGIAPLDVFILQYPGYEDRSGTPSREALLAAASEALQLIDTNRPIFLVGESLGSGVASYLAGKFPDRISGLILLSPFERLADVAQFQYPFLPVRWLLLDDLWSGKYLQSYHGPVGVMVDGRDRVVPERFGRRLYEEFSGPKRLWEFLDCGHIQIGSPAGEFWREVIEFWREANHSK